MSGPDHGTLTLNSNGSLAYMPTSNFNGADSFNYRVTDGKTNSSIATATILVSPGNDAPVAVDDRYTILENSNLVVAAAGVLANDADIDGDVLRAVLVAGPAHGTVTLSATNVTLGQRRAISARRRFTQTVNCKRAELDLGIRDGRRELVILGLSRRRT